jgi:hypothetical protein
VILLLRNPGKERTMAVLSGYISEHELAAQLGLSVWALRAWRRRGYGPAWAKIGKAVLYSAKAVEAFIDDQIDERASVLEAGRGR